MSVLRELIEQIEDVIFRVALQERLTKNDIRARVLRASGNEELDCLFAEKIRPMGWIGVGGTQTRI